MTTSTLTPDAAWRPGLASRILALTPLWLLLLLAAFSPDFVGALGTEPADTVGVPYALFVEGAAIGWMLVGVVVIQNGASRLLESLALTFFTIPATVVVVVTPVVTYVAQGRPG